MAEIYELEVTQYHGLLYDYRSDTVDKVEVYSNDTIKYTYCIKNISDRALYCIHMSMPVPDGLEFIASTERHIDKLEVGYAFFVSVIYRVTGSVHTIHNKCSVSYLTNRDSKLCRMVSSNECELHIKGDNKTRRVI